MTKAMKHCLCISAALASAIPFTFGAPPAVPFQLNEVELLDSPFLANKKRNADFLLSLSADRLMARMYEYCGETPKAPVYGGWESSDLSGHTLGHYLTALSLEYASTGDARFKERLDYIIGEMARCQKLYGESGYIGCMSRNARRALEVLKDGDVETINHTWAPWYTQHKIAAGLYDAWKIGGNEQAKDVLVNFARWVDGLTKGLDEKKCQRMLDMEFGGIGEVFWKLYAETKDETHKALAQRFRHHWLVDDLAAGKDNLAGKHANTQVPKVIAEAVNYEVTGDDFARKVSKNFFDIVVKNHTYVTGGNSDREHFYRPEEADRHLSPASVECCNVYNMIRLAEHLQMQEPTNTIYGDYRERALLNQILPSQDPERSMFTYFVSLKPGQFHVYSSPDQSFWCCFGTGIENHTKYNNGIFFHDDDNLFITLFTPSKLKWAERGLELTMNTEYPKNGKVTLTFDKAPDKKLALNVRCPGWADKPVTFSLNGRQIATGKPGENAVLNADWKTGDKVEIDIPMSLRTEHLHGGHTEQNAFFYGPTLLAGDLGEVENYQKRIYLRDQLDLQNAACKPVPILLGDNAAQLAAAAKPVPGSDRAYNLPATDGSSVLIRPFNQMPYQHYNVYWKNMNEAQWAAEKARIEAEAERQRERSARTVDEMNFGEQQPETDHAVKYQNTHSGRFNGRGYRGAHQGGWIEFRMKVSPDKKNILACTYWGGDNWTETAILADGQQIAVQKLSAAHPNQFFEVEYEIPESITKGKDHIVIRHQPAGERGGIGSVYHAAILTPPEKK